MSNTHEVGSRLIESDCHQGALVEAPARMLWLTRASDDQSWTTTEDTVEGAQLVVVSQNCDICAPVKTVPHVEAIMARWTNNASWLHIARKGNSARLFLLQENEGNGLIADARRRIHLDKTTLLGASFAETLHDDRSRMRFANWVAGRYNRPAIADELVNMVQKPIVSAVDELVAKNDSLLRVFERVAEFRFAVDDTKKSWTVHLVVMIDEDDELGVEEEAELADWLDGVLVTHGGLITAVVPLFKTERNISLQDYLRTIRLQLDHFTPEESLSET